MRRKEEADTRLTGSHASGETRARAIASSARGARTARNAPQPATLPLPSTALPLHTTTAPSFAERQVSFARRFVAFFLSRIFLFFHSNKKNHEIIIKMQVVDVSTLRHRILERLAAGRKEVTSIHDHHAEGVLLPDLAATTASKSDVIGSTASSAPPPPRPAAPVRAMAPSATAASATAFEASSAAEYEHAPAIVATAASEPPPRASSMQVQVELARRDKMLWQVKEQLAAERLQFEEQMLRAMSLIKMSKVELEQERAQTSELRRALVEEQRRGRITGAKLERSRTRERVLVQQRRRPRSGARFSASLHSSSSSSEDDGDGGGGGED